MIWAKDNFHSAVTLIGTWDIFLSPFLSWKTRQMKEEKGSYVPGISLAISIWKIETDKRDLLGFQTYFPSAGRLSSHRPGREEMFGSQRKWLSVTSSFLFSFQGREKEERDRGHQTEERDVRNHRSQNYERKTDGCGFLCLVSSCLRCPCLSRKNMCQQHGRGQFSLFRSAFAN